MSETKGLPANPEAERVILGAILQDSALYPDIAGTLAPDDFSSEKHRRIFRRMGEMDARGERIEFVSLANDLKKFGELDSSDGIAYLVSLTDGMPVLSNVDGWVRIVAEKSTLRKAIFAAQHLINRCMTAEDGSADILADAETTLQGLSRNQRHGQWMNPGQIIEQYPGGLQGLLSPASHGISISTPWQNLTESLCGLHAGDLFIVAGRTAMGKSIVAMQFAHHVAAVVQKQVAFFSLEMSKDSLIQRLICGIARIDAQRLRAGYLNTDERRRAAATAADLADLPLWIDDTRARTISAMTTALRKLAATRAPALVVIDHLQLMLSGPKKREANRNQELSDILHALKHEATGRDTTVMLVSQLNRQCEIENRRPQLSDLKETGTIEEDADVVMFVHRPERYTKNHGREDLRGCAEFIVAKQRNGPTGLKHMVFLDSIQRFDCRAEDWDQPLEGL